MTDDKTEELRRKAAELVRRSRLEQGLPETVEDPAVLDRLAELFRSSPTVPDVTKP